MSGNTGVAGTSGAEGWAAEVPSVDRRASPEIKIALPLQRQPRAKGNSVFVDERFEPWPDQWAFLASIRRISRRRADAVARQAESRGGPVGVCLGVTDDDDPTPWSAPASGRRRVPPVTRPLPVGRLHRLFDGKREMRVYDYADLAVPMLSRMFDRRCKGYEAVGYTILLPVHPEWKSRYGASVRRLIRDGVDLPLARLFAQATPLVTPDAEGADRARSATEAFLLVCSRPVGFSVRGRFPPLAPRRLPWDIRADLQPTHGVGFLAMKRLSLVLGIASGVIAVVSVIVPFFVDRDSAAAAGTGYLGYFVANYFGYGILLLPLLVKRLDPALLILVGTLGFTVDEVFAWYAGSVSDGLDGSKRLHVRIQEFVEWRGLQAVFVLGLLPLPGIVYAVSGFAAGHFKIPLYSFFLSNFLGKLIRTALTTVAVMILVR